MNLKRYMTQIADHRRRMKQWYHLYSEVIQSDNMTLKKVMYIHDLEKWIFLPWLYKYQKPDQDRIKARKLYDRMNKVGSLFVKLRCRKVNKVVLEQALWVEKTFDVLDRHLDPVALEEFRITEPKPLSTYLSKEQVHLAEKFIQIGREKIFRMNKESL